MSAATIRVGAGNIATGRTIVAATEAAPASGTRRVDSGMVASLYAPEDCAVSPDYAVWIAGDEAGLYSLRPARVPTF